MVSKTMTFICLFIGLIHQCYSAGIMDHVVFAVNAGGEAHVDSQGKKKREREELID